jgi:hypothetical protein
LTVRLVDRIGRLGRSTGQPRSSASITMAEDDKPFG